MKETGLTIMVGPERPRDFDPVARLHRTAFDSDLEPRLVDEIRHSPGFIGELSLVATAADSVIGHALFSPIIIETAKGDVPALALAPVAVLPEFQRLGIGSLLIRRGLEESRRLGHTIVVVLGHPAYYPRFGFVVARTKGISAPFPVVPEEAFMVMELVPGALDGVLGTVRYPLAFMAAESPGPH